ncbi:glycosyltransferase family 4 protein [Microbacterium betulae]|uniref:D-inositol 3-phosphate glycosyltransferase n=1 Tax=Microbacterium betulae TaxID=2981139 RepID=A0AA97I8Q5_9MICO|nr:glycosyltransferase family 4 protein [Microbacterium sp. AB]WOF24750.1 glycosyltransferase family 4 protein [Microbacterium sp. AB]
MRVAYICADPGIPVLGTKGASIHVQQIVAAFRRRGDDVTVYCTRVGDAAPTALGDAPIVSLPVARGEARRREEAVRAAAAGLAARASDDGCDLVYERYSLFSEAAVSADAPSVVEVNAPLIDEQRTYRTLVDDRAATAATRCLLTGADVVACVSEPVAAWARGHGAGVSSRVVVAPNGVNTRSFSPARIADGPLRAVFVGSLKPWHGVDAAIDAVAGLDGVELAVVGDGPERDALEQRARRQGVRVRWHGAVPHDDIPRILRRMHVGLAPYPAEAGDYFSPLKAYEYLAAGLPVVGSATGQLPSVVGHGRTGLLVPPGDITALVRALVELRDDRELARTLGAAAREQAVARHDWDGTLDAILSAVPDRVRAERAEARA